MKDVGLICEKKGTETPTHNTFWFKGNQKVEFHIRDTTEFDNDGDTSEFYYDKKFSERGSYSSNDQYINVYHSNDFGKLYGDWKTKIDHFTLKLNETFLVSESTADCKVYSSKDKFLSELKEIETSLRKFLDKRKI